MNIVSTYRYPQHRWPLVFIFCGIGIWCMAVFINGVTYGIEYSGKNSFSFHLAHMTWPQWHEGLFSLESNGFAIGCCFLIADLSGNWKRNRLLKCGLTLFAPMMVVWAGNGQKLALLILPIFIITSILSTPILSFELLFGEIGGGFFAGGNGTMLITGWWGILCIIAWTLLPKPRIQWEKLREPLIPTSMQV